MVIVIVIVKVILLVQALHLRPSVMVRLLWFAKNVIVLDS